MSEAPSWLTEENIATAKVVSENPAVRESAKKAVKKAASSRAAPPPPPAAATSAKSSSMTGAAQNSDVESGVRRQDSNVETDFIIEEEVLKQMRMWHIGMRISYMIAAILLATAAVLSLQNQTDLSLAFFAIYILFFSVLICCFEFALESVAEMIAINFGFMYTLSGRCLFIVLVGFMSFFISLFGKIAMGVLFAAMCIHIFIMFKFPRFEEYLRKKHYYEGKKAAREAAQRAKQEAREHPQK